MPPPVILDAYPTSGGSMTFPSRKFPIDFSHASLFYSTFSPHRARSPYRAPRCGVLGPRAHRRSQRSAWLRSSAPLRSLAWAGLARLWLASLWLSAGFRLDFGWISYWISGWISNGFDLDFDLA